MNGARRCALAAANMWAIPNWKRPRALFGPHRELYLQVRASERAKQCAFSAAARSTGRDCSSDWEHTVNSMGGHGGAWTDEAMRCYRETDETRELHTKIVRHEDKQVWATKKRKVLQHVSLLIHRRGRPLW